MGGVRLTRLLLLDTSCGLTSAGVVDAGGILGEVRLDLGRRQSSLLPNVVEDLLRLLDVSLQSLEGIGVVVGPGVYTGLRVGVCYAAGLAEALGVEVYPVSTLDAMAFEPPLWDGPTCAFVRAKRGFLYAAIYDDPSSGPCWGPYMVEAGDLMGRLAGSGVRLVRGPRCEELRLEGTPFRFEELRSPSIRGMIRSVEAGLSSPESPVDVRVMYLREPDFGPPSCHG
jgi:tRNA threonylcarbamoyl adenosine modification protein YeaZ